MEKLQISLANWMEGTGRSWREGGSQFDLKAKIMSAIKRLKRGDRGSPCLEAYVGGEGLTKFGPHFDTGC